MNKAAFITDTHIGLGFKDSRIYKTLDKYAEDMKDVKPDVIFHLGDVFHTKRPAADAVEFATTWFTKLAKIADSVVVLAGGHDTDARMGITAIDFLDDLSPNIKLVLEPMSAGNILLMPYTRRLTQEHFDMIAKHDIALLHQGIAEAKLDDMNRKYGALLDAVPLSVLAHLDLCLCGHIHTKWSSGNVHCIGSPYPTRRSMYSEVRDFPVLDLDDLEDFQWYGYSDTFKLMKVKIEYDPANEKALQKSLLDQLPPARKDTFYSVDIAVTGPVSQKLYLEIRKMVETIYKDNLDDLAVVSVLPTDQRDIISHLKLAVAKSDISSPMAMLEAWMEEKKRKAYFEANTKLRSRIMVAMGDIVSSISGKLDGIAD